MLIGHTDDCVDSWCWYMQPKPAGYSSHGSQSVSFFMVQRKQLNPSLWWVGLNRCFGSLRFAQGNFYTDFEGVRAAYARLFNVLALKFTSHGSELDYKNFTCCLLTFNMFDVPRFSLAKWPLLDKCILFSWLETTNYFPYNGRRWSTLANVLSLYPDAPHSCSPP